MASGGRIVVTSFPFMSMMALDVIRINVLVVTVTKFAKLFIAF